MVRCKDTARTNTKINRKDVYGNKVVIEEGTLVVIDQELNNNIYSVMLADTIQENESKIQWAKIEKNKLNINVSDVNRDIIIPSLIIQGFPEKSLKKVI